jgi:subfamily B ATP-binding cassette protein MsbA
MDATLLSSATVVKEEPVDNEAGALGWPSSRRLFARLWREALRPHALTLATAGLCMVAVAVMSSSQTYLMGPLIDKVFLAKDRSLLWVIAGGILAVFCVRSVARYLQEVLLVAMGQKIVADLQVRLFASLIHKDLAFLRDHSAGQWAARFTYDANLVRLAVCDVFLVAGKDTLTILTLIGLMFFSDWRMALVTLLIAPLSIYPVWWLGRRMRRISTETQRETGALTAALAETFQGIQIVKSNGVEQAQAVRVNEHAKSLTRLVIRSAWVGGAILPIVDGIGGLVVAVVIVYGGAQVIAQTLTPGSLLVFVGALVGAYAPVPSLSKVNITFQTGLAAVQRVFALMDHENVVVEARKAVALPRISGEVRLEGVTFSYGQEAVLTDLTLTAPAGSVTALVGRSGAGKSTVLNLVSRFYDPDHGVVRVNGVDLRGASFASLREAVAVVSQDVMLFDDTIANNIRLGRPGASDEDVRDAAEAAAAWEFINRLPQGLETRVGEHGARLSGGQRQRIAIARALLRDAPIVLLDEATSSQDAESEHHIKKALARLTRGRTVIVIAHQLATVRRADLIHVLDQGRVVESGRHEDLLARGGLYTHLHALQFPPSEAGHDNAFGAA